ncbi:MAG TPA: elongation factor G [Planctomycetota bacterium]
MRNLGIVAHIDAGKTTLSERILFYSGVERRMGEVHEGTATLDYLAEERARGITITAAATTVPWRGHSIHLIDTPGHVDFTVEVERCMRVLDGAVLVVNGVAGLQAQSETVWRQMQRHHVRALAFVNQLDRPGADFLRCVADLTKRLGVRAVPIQYPLVHGRAENALIDLLTLEAREFLAEDQGRAPRPCSVPPAEAEEAAVLRAELVDVLAEEDEGLLEAVLAGRAVGAAELAAALRARVLAGSLVPVLGGSALRNVGVQPVLDAVVDYLPSPGEVPPVAGLHALTGARLERAPDPAGPPCALCFKLIADPSEDLLFVRVYSGTLVPGMKLYNPRTKRMERIARILRMHADQRIPVLEAFPGEIVALTGCKQSVTGDTLCEHDEPILLERPVFPEPVLTRVVEPQSSGERERLRTALERLGFEDPTFTVREDEETGQWLIAGMGELHLEIKEHRLRDEFRLAVRVGQPRVAYREALQAASRGEARVDRVLGGAHFTGSIDLRLEPLPAEEGGGARVEWDPACPVPAAFRPAVAEALRLEAQVGPRFGYPLAPLRVRVVGGEPRPELDTEAGYVQAASQALRAALAAGEVAFLEPLMAFEIEAPAEAMSAIVGDLNAKHAEIRELTAEGDSRRVEGRVPLYHVFGYATTVRSLSQGRASFALTPAGFARVPEAELAARGLTWS